jgi:hypothetical protein
MAAPQGDRLPGDRFQGGFHGIAAGLDQDGDDAFEHDDGRVGVAAGETVQNLGDAGGLLTVGKRGGRVGVRVSLVRENTGADTAVVACGTDPASVPAGQPPDAALTRVIVRV